MERQVEDGKSVSIVLGPLKGSGVWTDKATAGAEGGGPAAVGVETILTKRGSVWVGNSSEGAGWGGAKGE